MCLRIKINEKVKVADKDIVCYKVVRKFKNYGSCDPQFVIDRQTPYQDAPIELHRVLTTELDITGEISYFMDTELITNGFHSFIYLNDAKNEMFMFGIAMCEDYKSVTIAYEIWECTIPKGSKYHEGYFLSGNSLKQNYASDKIRYDKMIDTTENTNN